MTDDFLDEFGEYCTRLQNMPTSIRGFCFHDEDGRCTIILNARLTWESNRSSWLHELKHIHRNDLDNPDYREYV